MTQPIKVRVNIEELRQAFEGYLPKYVTLTGEVVEDSQTTCKQCGYKATVTNEHYWNCPKVLTLPTKERECCEKCICKHHKSDYEKTHCASGNCPCHRPEGKGECDHSASKGHRLDTDGRISCLGCSADITLRQLRLAAAYPKPLDPHVLEEMLKVEPAVPELLDNEAIDRDNIVRIAFENRGKINEILAYLRNKHQ